MSNIEDIKFIEEMIKEYKTFGDLHNPDFEDTDRIYKALENMLKRIKELEEKNKHLKYVYDDCCKCLLDTIERQKIKDTIEEYKNRIEEVNLKKKNKLFFNAHAINYLLNKLEKRILEEK